MSGSAEPQLSAHDQCEAFVDHVLQDVNTVQFLVRSINELRPESSPLTRRNIKCVSFRPVGSSADAEAPKEDAVLPGSSSAIKSGMSRPNSGTSTPKPTHSPRMQEVQRAQAGYVWWPTTSDVKRGDIILKEEDMTSVVMTERNLRHELVHAYDDARGTIEPSDCLHHACSEIRAARLSGDCFVGEELRRGRFDPLRSGMQCVRRRATMAVENNPVCRGFSDRSVERVFHRCYNDYEPFTAPIYTMGSYGKDRFEL